MKLVDCVVYTYVLLILFLSVRKKGQTWRNGNNVELTEPNKGNKVEEGQN